MRLHYIGGKMSVYILCPANRVTGGVELAHQLCYAINSLTDMEAIMWYRDIDNDTEEAVVVDKAAPDDYLAYHTNCVSNFCDIDRKENVIIFPEGLTGDIELIKHAKRVLWWMSVDNYIDSTGEKNLNIIKDNIKLHLYQSFYAMDYVNKKIPGASGMFLSDYINEEHGKFIFPAELRKNMALYNPRKGYKDVKPLIQKAGWLDWVPLFGMPREKIILFMQMAKIYVDFGHHPGKDRIPREAAANGCCVITNKKGSASNKTDLPIPEKYKFENPSENYDEVDALMNEICDNFSEHMHEFDDYREIIKSEKKKFDEGVIELVKEIMSW